MTPEDAVEKLLEHGKMIELAVPAAYGLAVLCAGDDNHTYRMAVAYLCSWNNMNLDSYQEAYQKASKARAMERAQWRVQL